MEEIWKDVKGYEGKYQVSNLGRVKSLDRVVNHNGSKTRTFPEKILKPNKVAFDYLQVTLYKNGKRKCKYIHNLVMESFVGEKLEGYEVNHIDEDKSNNKLTNLEYLTRKENNNYGTRIKRMSEKNTNGKKSKRVKGVHIENGTIIYFPSLAEASRNGYHHVYDVIKGNRNHCKKYKWYYV